MTRSLQDLPHNELVDQFTDMVRWYHYDPYCADRPSQFEFDDLEEELRRRLAANDATQLNEDA